MSVIETTGLEPALEAETAGAVEESFSPAAGSGQAAPNSGTGEAANDRISIDVLSKEPVKTFLTDAASGAIRTVQLDDQGRAVALTTGISRGEIAAAVLEGSRAAGVVERPRLRETTNSLTNAPETEVVDPKTGEILEVVQENDTFDLDEAVRKYIRKELLDTSC